MVTTVRTAAPAPRRTTNERVSALLVVLVTLAALIAGFLLRDSAESATRSFTTPYNLTVGYPEGWRINDSDAANRVVMSEPGSGRFPTTFEVTSVVVDASASFTDVLGTVGQNLATSRGADLTAYKVLDIQNQTGEGNNRAALMIKGLPAMITRYAYVSTPNSVFTEGLPTVVVGTDYLLRKDNRVYVFTVQSTEENEPDAKARFERFVQDARIP
ncbi:MAG: hypothetical protein M3437_16005 [Chloroflexota bacterium]|nr:hypothetical protein [Chloroflexota bacterium]MDQ5866754.1 hypothetical protein [Chloroflexota bacterium]